MKIVDEKETMQLAERVFVKENDAMALLCSKQTTLYNQALWYLRQEYFNNDNAGEGFLTYYDLNDKTMLKWKPEYRDAIPGCAANTIQRCCDAWKAYWKAMKSFYKNPSSFTGKPKMPYYVPRDSKSPVYFTYIQFSIKNGCVVFPKATGFDPVGVKRLKDQKVGDSTASVKQVRVIPCRSGGYWIEAVHNVEKCFNDVSDGSIMGIDLGMHDLATIVDNVGGQPVSFNGSDAKQVNQWYNKEMARLKSDFARSNPRLAMLQRKRETGLSDMEWKEMRFLLSDTKQMKTVAEKRNRRIERIFHAISKRIIEIALKRKIGKIVVGHNEGQKQHLDKGRKFNQQFGQLPIFKLVSQIAYKAELNGIELVEITEEFTSKASFLDDDPLPDRKNVKKKPNGHSDIIFSGKRVKRGNYRSKNGVYIQADVNAAYNILRRGCPDAFGLNGEGTRLYPLRVNVSPG